MKKSTDKLLVTMFEANANANSKDNGVTPLHWALTEGNAEIAKLLLA